MLHAAPLVQSLTCSRQSSSRRNPWQSKVARIALSRFPLRVFEGGTFHSKNRVMQYGILITELVD